jgi:hypothetical protein
MSHLNLFKKDQSANRLLSDRNENKRQEQKGPHLKSVLKLKVTLLRQGLLKT